MHPDAHAQILMSGVGTFINLMEEEEEEAFEKRKGDFMKGHDAKTEIASRFRMMRSNLQGAVKKAELVVTNADMDVKTVPRFASTDSRFKDGMLMLHEAVAKQGLAIKVREKAIADQNHFAKEFVFFRFPIKDACGCGTEERLIELCEDIEARLRSGEKVSREQITRRWVT